MEQRKSNELQIGKAGEYLACADLCMMGLIAFPSEQGLPYDVLIDVDNHILKCQVKTTLKPRIILQRKKETKAYIFNVKRKGTGGLKRYSDKEVDVFALVCLDARSVGYILNKDMPDTINIRVDALRGTYYDEKGISDYKKAIVLSESISNQSEIARKIRINVATVNRMFSDDYKPHTTNARYFSDLIRDREWFECLKI